MRLSSSASVSLGAREHIVTHDHDAQVYFIEFVQSVDELRGLGSAAQQLKRGALEENSRLQSCSEPLLQCYHHLHRVHEVRFLPRLSTSLRPSLWQHVQLSVLPSQPQPIRPGGPLACPSPPHAAPHIVREKVSVCVCVRNAGMRRRASGTRVDTSFNPRADQTWLPRLAWVRSVAGYVSATAAT
jgi:hypothetical protein